MTKTDDSASQALDRVYAARPSDFVAERKKIVAELRASGDREGAAKVAEAHRPTATAWAINHVVRKNPDMVARFTDAIEALRKAQRALLEGKASPNENAKLRAERTDLDLRTAEFLNLAREALESENLNWNVTTQRRIATSLRTLPSATAEDRERLLAGRLEKDLDTGDEDSLLETALGLSGVEIKRAPHPETPKKKPDHEKPAQSKAEAQKAKVEEQRRLEKERHEREEKTRCAAEQLARERAHAQRLKFLEREAEHLESKATYAEEAAVKARAASDAAKVAVKKAKEQKP
jgi:hypothetical protein